MIATTLVFGASAEARERTIAAQLTPGSRAALILEGFPDGKKIHDLHEKFPHVVIERIASGCVCCTGNIVMRVTLNRIIRKNPERLYLSIASHSHTKQIKNFLSSPPYDALLAIGKDLYA